MIPHKSLIKHDPANGKWGDCFRASVAAILDIDDVASVPHFLDGGASGEVGMRAFSEWLASRNMVPVWLTLDGSLTLQEALEFANGSADAPYILLGQNIDGGHCVICKGAEVWHDVAWIKTPMLRGAGPDGEWMIIYFGVRLSMAVDG